MTKERRQQRIKELQQKHHRIDARRKDILKMNRQRGDSRTKILKGWMNDISKALDVHFSKLED